MKSLRARISDLGMADRRAGARWNVELLVSAGPGGEMGEAVVRNLSDRGLMLQTGAELHVGETMLVDLPGADPVEARILWRQDSSYGCEFMEPIPSSVISEVLLRAPLETVSSHPADSLLEEFPVAVNPTVSQIAEWKARFERNEGSKGYRLIAFRQTSDGLFIAIAAKTRKPDPCMPSAG